MASSKLSSSDPNSYSNPDEAVIEHIFLCLSVDFNSRKLAGYVNLRIKVLKKDASLLVLDTDNLKIHRIYDIKDKSDVKYELDEPDKIFGSRLAVELPKPTTEGGEIVNICIEYETDPKASALQWLNPEQTAGGKHPFVFSQCQPIHCRSMVPCQDSPAVKSTYTAHITAPIDFTVLMSAIKDDSDPISEGKQMHRYHQNIPIPSYLIAIAVGHLESRKIGPRSHVWSEPELVDAAAHEFCETETMLSRAEEICGDYAWSIYDLLVMPPSFPFGGMENPCLTFVTPTLLAGDRSLACVVAHEIAHSWTGNLVTNRNFEHFWLNEGFTMFVERKITGRMKGEKMRQFSALNGLNDLKEAIKQIGDNSPLTKLVVDLKGIHPDDAFSTCPYEKGFTFLYYLETQVGGPDVFEQFLQIYLQHYKFKTVDTNEFKSFFLDYFAKNNGAKNIDWDLWLYTPGMPPIIPEYDKSLLVPCTELVTKWVKWDGSNVGNFNSDEIHALDSLQIQEFLAQLLLLDEFPLSKVIFMNEVYELNKVTNSEIRFRWLRLCLKAKWYDAVPLALEFATQYGRMKFVRPLFRDLYNWDLTREKAIAVFKSVQSQMMHVTAAMVAKDLHITL